MKRSYDIVTFDCYGTLVDWRGGIARALTDLAGQLGVDADADELLRLHAEIEPQIQSEGYRTYRDVLTELVVRIAERKGWTVSSTQAGIVGASLPRWPPFDDTIPALRAMRTAGYRLGILSNIDTTLLEQTLRRIDVPIDLIVTAEDVRSYKPGHAHFLTARERIDGARWLHAAQSYFHDVVPCQALDIPVVWVNRLREARAGDPPPTGEVDDVAQLARWLGVG